MLHCLALFKAIAVVTFVLMAVVGRVLSIPVCTYL